MKSKKIGILLICILLSMVLLSCSKESEETMSNKNNHKLIKVNYKGVVANLEEQLKKSLSQLGLARADSLEHKRKAKKKQVTDYLFTWDYNYHKFEVPLFGPHGKLLSDYKEEIIAKFKDDFPIVKANWRIKEQERILTLELGFLAQSDLELLTHKVTFVQQPPAAKMAIVIDDLGFNRKGTEEILKIKRPLTFAVLPHRPFSKVDAKLVKEAGQELILHQPLEPLNPKVNPGAGAINSTMTNKEIKSVLKGNLANLPQLQGINNHMGSKATANPRVMKAIIEVLKKKGLYYVDSSTAHNSVGFEVAQKNNLPTAANYLFIDNIDKKKEIKEMLLTLGKIALKEKEMVVIGHVRENTALAIKEVIPKLEKMGVKLVFASQLVQ
ncbi:hypothetical protein Halha_2204 [Halobacteroides halobius DSM 5150]|uniref:Divergent polysaccharide deacetylase n=1 Tax=Halobacteroides halobius (strain ATCC 35273 / DSM 5150 / MD-1) TaxID=748449 RepID=L0K9U1_HALHC|nr:divergent polysaccharide deacetylase family protein [Halobacteroides halobius]AGB42082.1 hypothetical protein Halha_2204 [Halobacteroides halobius DSM 5150]